MNLLKLRLRKCFDAKWVIITRFLPCKFRKWPRIFEKSQNYKSENEFLNSKSPKSFEKCCNVYKCADLTLRKCENNFWEENVVNLFLALDFSSDLVWISSMLIISFTISSKSWASTQAKVPKSITACKVKSTR